MLSMYDYCINEQVLIDPMDIESVEEGDNGHSFLINMDGLVYEVSPEDAKRVRGDDQIVRAEFVRMYSNGSDSLNAEYTYKDGQTHKMHWSDFDAFMSVVRYWQDWYKTFGGFAYRGPVTLSFRDYGIIKKTWTFQQV